MSKQTTITGASDDLLEFDGHLYEELYANKAGTITFSDGTQVGVVYDKGGIWRFTLVSAGPAFGGILPCPDEAGEDDYTDALTMREVDWAKYDEKGRATQRVYAKGVTNPVKEIEKIIERNDAGEAAELLQQLFEKRLAAAARPTS